MERKEEAQWRGLGATDEVKGGSLEADTRLIEKCITRRARSVAYRACGHNISRGNGESAWAGC